MTDYERTTTRQTTTVDPTLPAYADPATAPAQAASVQTTERAHVAAGPSGATTAARVVTFAFGVLQAALILRIILLLLVANTGNDIVALILNVTEPFVEPFRGMFAFDRVAAGDSRLDVAAVVALIGWTLLELLILAALRIFSRQPAEAV
jgi:uncharacterized protein YggT (Ycf19 family)